MRVPRILASACSTALVLAGGPTDARAQGLRVLDILVLGESRHGGEKIGEFSALVRDPDGGGVLAISDRGYIAELALDPSGDRISGLEILAVHVLAGPDGVAMREHDFNPEGAALLADGSIAIVSEDGPRLSVFDVSGRWLRDEALPEPLCDPSTQARDKDGVESLGWTGATGFVAVTEEPQPGQPRSVHTLYATLAGPARIIDEGPEAISMKAIEIAGSQIILLERTRDDATDALYPWLRIIDLEACLRRSECSGQRLPIPVEPITDADFEGLAALDGGRFLMVSDDKIDGALRSVFVLFRVE